MGSDKLNPTAGNGKFMESAVKASLTSDVGDQRSIRLFIREYGFTREEIAARWGYGVRTVRRLVGDEGEMHAICALERHGLCLGAVQDAIDGAMLRCMCECHRSVGSHRVT